ncbi:MAG: pseudouridine-5'-phosphate glycosidase [Flavobacteriales bacterium]
MSSILQFNEEVREAIATGKAIVALESTIIAHGMPFPQNVETALKVEQTIRENGAVPATIACIEGKICVGLNEQQLHLIASSDDVLKLSRRDLPLALSQKKLGATTVAATMIGAEMAGIRLFATGGIGGVHRGVELSGDVSADLNELGQTSVAVVSAGAKAILDIPRTLEYLETWGVPVIGFQSDFFGAFYSRSSGIPVEMRMDSEKDIASFLNAKWNAGMNGGVLISNPIPEAYEIPHETIEPVIKEAVAEAERQAISGKRLTPFLLGKIKEVTQGKSLESNIALVLNNAALAARIAKALK